ncbi:MAG: DUF2812 domain-containing protein [Streptococcaceae bacterium]|jgi:hypothetical protein|nr:DUF2812 domain-containing protein [Streptococcaceae bacterium]
MKRFRLFVDFDKEENYLNQMARKGWELQHYSWFGFYTFKKGAAAEKYYRIDYRTFKNRQKYNDYVNFLDEAGWKQVSGSYHSGYRFFLPKTGQTEDLELFSDEASRKLRVKNLSKNTLYSFSLSLLYLVYFWINRLNDHLFSLFDPRTWAFSPDLWEKTGWQFTLPFLLELPFVIIGVLLPFILVALTVILGIWTYRAYLELKKE